MKWVSKIALTAILSFCFITSSSTFTMDFFKGCNLSEEGFQKMNQKEFMKKFRKCSASSHSNNWLKEKLRRTKNEYNSYHTFGSYIWGSSLEILDFATSVGCPLIASALAQNINIDGKKLTDQEKIVATGVGSYFCTQFTGSIFNGSRKSRIKKLLSKIRKLEEEIDPQDDK